MQEKRKKNKDVRELTPDLEEEFRRTLQRLGLDPQTIYRQQFVAMRDAFYAGASVIQLLLLEVSDIENEDDGKKMIGKVFDQIKAHWDQREKGEK